MSAFDVPVVLILFNRPERVAEVIDALRVAAPRHIIAIADGPRSTQAREARTPADAPAAPPADAPAAPPADAPADPPHGQEPDDATRRDAARCADARAQLDAIDWPCTLDRQFADTNLGCDERIRTGLDYAFATVQRAVILEDDVLPHPDFLPWAASMLDRYSSDPTFSIASGCNKLGTWGEPGADHLRAQRGSIWGWASTATTWHAARALDLADIAAAPSSSGTEPGLARVVDPLVSRQTALVLEEVRKGRAIAWDTEFSARCHLMGRTAAISTVNLISNRGVGPDATRTKYEEDFVATLPSRANVGAPSNSGVAPASGYDRASLLAELLGRCVNPDMALRLARVVAANPKAPIDEATRLHLEPFLHLEESLGLLDHLAHQGVESPQFERVRATLRRSCGARAER